jgi:hypothetical protein
MSRPVLALILIQMGAEDDVAEGDDDKCTEFAVNGSMAGAVLKDECACNFDAQNELEYDMDHM